MNDVYKYFGIIVFTVFSFYYTDKVIEMSKNNDIIMVSINEYAQKNDYECVEGFISEEGIVLGINGLKVDKSKSYSNMKGTGYKEELLEYKKNNCILDRTNNIDKYILKSNPKKNAVAIVLDVDNYKYYKEFLSISKSNSINISLLVNNNYFNEPIIHDSLLYKGNSEKELKQFLKNVEYETFCVKTNNYNIINDCKKLQINSIKATHIIENNLLLNTKNLINKGDIIFIKERKNNLEEFTSTIKYLKGKAINIVSIYELLS